jgi:hypothetical protein
MATNAPAAHMAYMLAALLNKGLEQAQTKHTGYIRLYSHGSTQPTQPLN